MIFAPYRSVLDLAQDMNGDTAGHQRQLAWDEIDVELSAWPAGAVSGQLSRLYGLASRLLRSRPLTGSTAEEKAVFMNRREHQRTH